MKRRRISTIGVVAAALVISALAPVAATHIPDPNFGWAHGIGIAGSVNSSRGHGIAVDGSSNTYVTGRFRGTNVDFDPGTGEELLTSGGNTDDIFVAKYAANGNLLWARGIGDNGQDEGVGIAVDGDGNAYVIGRFNGTVDFDPGSGTPQPLVSAGLSDVFVAKYDSNGGFEWAHRIGGGQADFGRGIAVNAIGDVYITGSFRGDDVEFDPDAGDPASQLTSTGGSGDAFVAKYNTNGGFVWAHNIGGSSTGSGIAVDGSGSAYVTGSFAGVDVDFDPDAGGTGSILTSSVDEDNAFVVKYDTDGDFIWAHNISSESTGENIAVDGSGSAYVTGSFEGIDVDFNPGAGTHPLSGTGGSSNVFVAKYNTNGEFVWAHSIGGTGYEAGYGIAVDASANTYVTGAFQSPSANFNPGGTAHLLHTNGGDDVFVAKYDPSGILSWAYSAGADGTDRGEAIALDGSGGALITGGFQDTVDFNPGGAPHVLSAKGPEDILILKLEPGQGPDPGVFRLSGANRFETAAAVAAHHHPDGADTVFVATGTNFPDALAGAVAAASAGSPLLLVSSIPPATAGALGTLNPEDIIILGGTAVVDAATAAALGAYGDVTRLSGANRYDTAVEISKSVYPTDGSADAVVIATGTNFPDALAAASLAAQVNGPVLLTPTGSLPASVAAEIERLDPTIIYIIGGTAAISTGVANQLADIAITKRLSGANRYDTAIAISVEAFPAGADIVYVAVGTNFPDALAGAAQAAAHDAPVLLTPTDSLPASVATEITRLGAVQIIILGGTSVISPTVEAQLAALLP